MPKYRVKTGFRHGNLNQYGPGDVVELTEEEAAGFLDKLELVKGSAEKATTDLDADAKATLLGPKESEAAKKPAANKDRK